jgi:hypothetical protein
MRQPATDVASDLLHLPVAEVDVALSRSASVDALAQPVPAELEHPAQSTHVDVVATRHSDSFDETQVSSQSMTSPTRIGPGGSSRSSSACQWPPSATIR